MASDVEQPVFAAYAQIWRVALALSGIGILGAIPYTPSPVTVADVLNHGTPARTTLGLPIPLDPP